MSDYVNSNTKHYITPDDPEWKQPLTMGDPYEKGLTPKSASAKIVKEAEDRNEPHGYGGSQIAHMPENWVKYAQSVGVNNIMTQPMWFSPLHTPQNWQIASKRRETYQWARFFYENEPKVAAAIDFYSQFPLNGFKLECKSTKIAKWFEHHVVKRLGLNEFFQQYSQEYYMLGDVVTHTDIECPVCAGTSIDPDTGESCNHPGGTIGRVTILNPDWVEVQRSPHNDDPVIVMIPDEEMKRIVFTKKPKAIYDRIPDKMKELIMQGRPIPLSARTTSHMRHMPAPYGTYGTSLIRRLFTTLAYKTKIMTANWIVAERLILPIRVVKVGSDNRPASPADIADIQQQLAQTANDPNLTIVTHNNFDFDWYGTSGKVLQITQEMEHIDKEILDGVMLNQSLLNGEMSGYCHSSDTLTLTDSGFKNYEEIDQDDMIACYNPESNTLEYHPYTQKHVYDYVGDMIQFETDKIDILVTPNHKMWCAKRDSSSFDFVEAKDVKRRARFVGAINNYKGINKKSINVGKHSFSTELYCKLAGYYLSEGHTSSEKRKNRLNQLTTLHVCQSDTSVHRADIESIFSLSFDHFYTSDSVVSTYNPDIAQHFNYEFGNKSHNKFIPPRVKNLHPKYLEILLESMINGDGHIKTYDNRNVDNISYYTSSYKLALDVCEIAFKCGYVVKLSKNKQKKLKKKYFNKDGFEYKTKHQQYTVHLSKGFKGRSPVLDSKSKKCKGKEIQRVPYDGKTYCFTVPTGLFVTMRNGKIAIQGNSSAQVGVETLIRRIESWRHKLKEWCEENIFKPIAEMQGFVDEQASEEIGETVYLYPKIKWNKLQLRDEQPRHQILMQLHDKQVISTQTMLEELDFDYDQEVERLRYEQAVSPMPMGGMGGAGGDGGMGLGGGMGGAGGMPGEGMDPMGGMSGMGDMGGGAPGAPGGDMGGMGAPGGPMASGMKVTKKGKSTEQDDESAQPQMSMVKLTSIEQKMAKMLHQLASNMKINPNSIRAQFPIQKPEGGKPWMLDFALPNIKLGVEVDGEVWHSNAEQVSGDQKRDHLLAQRGWTILRFNDKTIDDAPQAVTRTISSYIKRILTPNAKKQSSGDSHLFITKEGELHNLKNNYGDYNKNGLAERLYVSDSFGG